MTNPHFRDLGYCLALATLGGVLAASGARLAGGDALRRAAGLLSGEWPGTSADAERFLGLALAALGIAVLAWWMAAMAASVGAALLHRRGRPVGARRLERLSPAFMRRVVAAALGANVLLAPAAQASAPAPPPAAGASAVLPAPVGDPARSSSMQESVAGPYWSVDAIPRRATDAAPRLVAAAGNRAANAPDPGWTAERPARAMDPVLGAADRRDSSREVVVVRGDTLWSIAARGLGAGATPAEIATEWPRWYEANRAAIGTDPDHLLVGTVLERPRA